MVLRPRELEKATKNVARLQRKRAGSTVTNIGGKARCPFSISVRAPDTMFHRDRRETAVFSFCLLVVTVDFYRAMMLAQSRACIMYTCTSIYKSRVKRIRQLSVFTILGSIFMGTLHVN